ncbi:FAD-dependent oxidoreductase [Helicobacter burdigaliensis]|uniref:FAD-dependent oxidoreductase n=1 Tax=Helicobacter burdigaliensis TaxID=2315334 RepID=UPI000EF69546|nr:FAD-dependent oxidoreductase [Helicobacter burdigaliensis]
MKNIKVAIVGGSIAGLSSALVLASAIKNELNFEISIFDEGGSKADLYKAEIYNVPLFPRGIGGKEIIEKTKEQINSLAKVSYIEKKVDEISGSKGDFSLVAGGENFGKFDYVILATGAGECAIKGLEDKVKPHPLMPKPGKIMLENSGRNLIKEGMYAAGLASGVTTMVACAMGSANESACAILSDIAGTTAVIHDLKGSRS